MILILGSIFLTSFLLVLGFLADEEIWWLIGAIVGLVALIILILWPISYASSNSAILQFKAVEASLEAARNNPNINEYELAALQHKVVEMNKWLASAKYWANNSWTSWFWTQDVNKLEPIK
jgi:hypothetical protein